ARGRRPRWSLLSGPARPLVLGPSVHAVGASLQLAQTQQVTNLLPQRTPGAGPTTPAPPPASPASPRERSRTARSGSPPPGRAGRTAQPGGRAPAPPPLAGSADRAGRSGTDADAARSTR